MINWEAEERAKTKDASMSYEFMGYKISDLSNEHQDKWIAKKDGEVVFETLTKTSIEYEIKRLEMRKQHGSFL